MVCNLVYWAKATVIFPICETTDYTVNPDLEEPFSQDLQDRFQESFPGSMMINHLVHF